MARGETYEQFIQKFKLKHTTDDCFTPPKIYEAVKDWAVKQYNLEGREIIRPFYPGGDYENYTYPANAVVIDNPPFSIRSAIEKFYTEKGIDFFLFVHGLTVFSSFNPDVSYVIIDRGITYENGAKVLTCFSTNLEPEVKIRTAPELDKKLVEIQGLCKKQKTVNNYPPEVVTSTTFTALVKRGVKVTVKKNECHFIRALDQQRAMGKSLYGAGFLINTEKAKEIRKGLSKTAKTEYNWALSDREKQIIKELNEAVN